PDEARRAVGRGFALGSLSLREGAGVRVRRSDDSQATAANHHARSLALLAPSPPGRGVGGGSGEVTTVKPPLPTTALETSRRLRRGMTDAERKVLRGL